MRLFRLDLTRYGKFTDHVIDFGPRRPGRPDLHIVYGPNEAGKSTSLAAFLDLLFGIEMRSRYGFQHPYATMRIGAALEINGGLHELIRIKRPQNSLLDRDEQPIAARLMLGELGGIDRDAYRTMFSLDDESLEAGGNSILASKGDLGQLLFSASSGLADLSQSLADLREEADTFHKRGAHKTELAQIKAELAALKAQRDGIDTFASAYGQLIASRDMAAALYEKAIAERQSLRSTMDAIQRKLQALPRLAELVRLREALAPLAELPEAPAHWFEDLPELQRHEIDFGARHDAVAQEILRLSAAIDAIMIDGAALRLAARIDGLGDLRARHSTAEKDLPERRLRLRGQEQEVAGLLRRLGREDEADPAALVLTASVTGRIQALLERRSGVEADVRTTARELEAAQMRRLEAQQALKAQGAAEAASPDIEAQASGLAKLLVALRSDDHAARRRAAETAIATLTERLAEDMLFLKPWAGDIEDLAGMIVPERAEIEAWKAAKTEAQRRIDRRRDEAERLRLEAIRLKAEWEAIGAVSGVVDDGQAATLRSAREAAWADHRRSLDEITADRFEALLRQDDLATAARSAHSAEVAKLHQVALALNVTTAKCEEEERLHAAALAEGLALQARIAAAIEAMGAKLDPRLPLPRFEAWLNQRGKLLETRTARKSLERDLGAAVADGARARLRLAETLAALGVAADAAASLDGLQAAAETWLERSAETRRLRSALTERQAEMVRRQKACDEAVLAEQKWTAEWTKLCASCWLGRDGPCPNPAEVRAILPLTVELGSVLKARNDLADRIRKMEIDQIAFAEDLGAIADDLGIAAEGQPIRALDQAVRDRLLEARTEQAARATDVAKRAEAEERLRVLANQGAIVATRKAEMTALFGVSTLAEVGYKLGLIRQRAELQNRKAEVERAICEALGAARLEQAEAMLEGADRAALEDEFGALKGRFEDSDRHSQELHTRRSKAEDQLEAVGGDAEVARIEERRRTLLLDIEERALRHIRLRAGILAAEQALRLYREQHRSSMMVRASDAFRTISRGAYRGLASQPDKDSEVLLGLGADGSSKLATDMSKGTRFQLYLALRVAGYHEFAQSRSPVPFIADDIMETFDDFRAEEAFRLFAEMAEVGQVIYLTHHQHLCDIGQRVCPEINIHRLSPP